MLVLACLSIGVSGQSTKPPAKARSISQSANIMRFFIEGRVRNSEYETGPLHIIYDDGTDIVQTLPPLKTSTEKNTVYNTVGFSDVRLAEDRQTLGWLVNVENCCTSYAIPLSVVVFRDKQVLHTFSPGLMVWSWEFVQGGQQVKVDSGTVHGSDVTGEQLYDVKSGKLLSETSGDGDESSQAISTDAPKLAATPGDDLIHAAQKGDLRRVRALLGSHVDVNSRLNGNLDGGTTALIEASRAGHRDVVKALLDAGADLEIGKGKWGTALVQAAETGQLETVWALIGANADLNAADQQGTTALMAAAQAGYEKVVAALIECNADPRIKAHNGGRAEDFARRSGYQQIAELLSTARSAEQ
jgi:hypothetical protein